MSESNWQELFTSIYEQQLWNGRNPDVPLSGPGSSLSTTQNLRNALETYLTRYNIKTVLDLGCGDLTWIKTTSIFKNSITYIGYDVVPSLIKSHSNEYAADPSKRFVLQDITAPNTRFPKADLVLVRDVLFHLPSKNVLSLLDNLRNSDFSYVLLTSHAVEVNTDNFDRWHYRPINLLRPPYSLPLPTSRIPEPAFHREVYFYRKEDLLSSPAFKEESSIPKCIHQIWLGPNPIPQEYLQYMESWKKHHPTWEYKLWTDKEVATYPMQHRLHFESVNKYAQKADILRYDILYREGGLYVDCDFEALAPLDALLERKTFVIGYERQGILCNALIASIPGHPILKEVQERLPYSLSVPAAIPCQTGPGFITDIIHPIRHLPGVYLAPTTIFYPYLWDQHKSETYPKETLAVHHWGKSWL